MSVKPNNITGPCGLNLSGLDLRTVIGLQQTLNRQISPNWLNRSRFAGLDNSVYKAAVVTELTIVPDRKQYAIRVTFLYVAKLQNRQPAVVGLYISQVQWADVPILENDSGTVSISIGATDSHVAIFSGRRRY